MGRKLRDFFTLRKLEKRASGKLEPLVSIVVRTKDRPKLLREALGSLQNQTYKNLEVIVVNDGSTGAAKDIFTRIADEFPQVHIEH